MNPYIFRLSFFSLRWYSFLILIGALIGIFLVKREGKKFNINQDFLFNLAFWTIIIGIIGARIYYVLFNINLYKSNPLSMFKIWEGGLAVHGGIIAGGITMFVYCKRYNFSFFRVADIVVPSFILAQAIGRWGNFFNGEAHGPATSLAYLQGLPIPEFVIKGMNINGIYYIPTFYYESMLCLLGFVLLLIFRRFKYVKIGQVSAMYLIYYGFVRFFIESLRTDSLMVGGFKTAQVVSIILVLAGIYIIGYTMRKGKFENLYNSVSKDSISF